MIRRDYLIVGAGIAGVSVCEGIREHDAKGTIMMVGNESALPYDRSALLKAYLNKSAAPTAASLQLHDEAWYEKHRIDLRLDTVVTQLNLERRVAVFANGQAIEFRKACMATGSRARRPQVAGATLGNVFYLRTLRDVQALREVAENERQMVVIGGGLIGAESAALLSKFPKVQVTYMHRGPAIWNRTLDAETAAWLTEYYRQQGVQMMMSEALNGFEGRTVLKNVQTKSGHRVAAGLAIAALGAEPNLGLMANTPLAYPHGTPVNEYLETDEKGIFAAGDIAAFPDKIFGSVRRVDHSPCPQEQGRVAGANMTGKKRIKWDWLPHYSCNVFDLQFDFVGDFNGPPTRIELEGDRAKKKFIVRHYQLAQLRGVVLCNQDGDKLEAAKKQIREWPWGKKSPSQG